MTNEAEKMSFEEALKKLEEIVATLEKDDIPLEKSISLYEEGMKLSKVCGDILQNAEEKMTVLLKDDGSTEIFDVQEDSLN